MRTYKFGIYPSDAQITILNNTLELCRELYNSMLQQRIYAYRWGKKIYYKSQQNEIPELKNTFPEYRSIHSLVIQDVARRLDRAFHNFYRRMGEKRKGMEKMRKLMNVGRGTPEVTPVEIGALPMATPVVEARSPLR